MTPRPERPSPIYSRQRVIHLRLLIQEEKEIKKRSPGTECIIITGYASKASAIEAINTGAYAYVEKPYDMEQLLLMIRRAIEKREAEEALRESEERLRIQNQIANIFLTKSDEDMYGEILNVVLDMMESKFGVFGYIDDQGDLVCPSMTRDIWDECQISDKTIVFPANTWGKSIWGTD
jgi:hypothetical protein